MTEATIESLTADMAGEREARAAAEQSASMAKSRIAELEQENETLGAQVRAWKGQTTRARSEVEKLKRSEGAPLRAAGPMKDGGTPEEARGRIWDALSAGEVSLVCSDGKREIRELAPLKLGGDLFQQKPGFGLVLDHEPLLDPGEMEKPSVQVAGFALFAGEKQVAWSGLPDPVTVQRGGRVLIPANSIRF